MSTHLIDITCLQQAKVLSLNTCCGIREMDERTGFGQTGRMCLQVTIGQEYVVLDMRRVEILYAALGELLGIP